jgi:hypothetical protein
MQDAIIALAPQDNWSFLSFNSQSQICDLQSTIFNPQAVSSLFSPPLCDNRSRSRRNQEEDIPDCPDCRVQMNIEELLDEGKSY